MGDRRLQPLRLRTRGLILALLATLLGFAAATGNPRGRPAVEHIQLPRPLLDVAVAIGIVAMVAATVVLALVLRPQRRSREDETPEVPTPVPTPLWVRIVAPAVPLLVLAAFLLALHALSGGQAQQAQPLAQPRPVPLLTSPASPRHEPIDILPVLLIAAAIGAALLVALAIASRRGRRTDPFRHRSGPIVPTDEDIDATAERDPRKGVLLAYAAMEQTLARRGAARRPGEAPREYLARARPAPRTSARRLTRLFERARYSFHPIGDDDRLAALEALDEVRSGEPCD